MTLRSIRTSLAVAFLACGVSGRLVGAAAPDLRAPEPPLQNWYAPPTFYRAAPALTESQQADPVAVPVEGATSLTNEPERAVPSALARTPLVVAPQLAYTYTPIAPCRQYNTVSPVNPLLQGTNRAVTLTGAPCGIPSSAVAVSANVTIFNITGAGGNGVFKVDTVSPPASAWINYPPTEAQRANAGVLALNASGQIIVQVAQGAGQVDFVVDINGFYSATSLDAIVNADGTLARGIHTTGSVHVGTGAYEVDFDRDVQPCFWVATIGNPASGNPSHGTIVTALRAGNNSAVFVETRDVAGTLADRGIVLHVTCTP